MKTIILAKVPQEFRINENIKIVFDGRFMQTKLDGKMVLSQPAHVGDAFHIQLQSLNEIPIITRAERPTNRGAKIAWALHFIGKSVCMDTQANFYTEFDRIQKENTITNIAAFTKFDHYAVVLADKYEFNATRGKKMLRRNVPVLAWISDDIPLESLRELLERFEKRKKLTCSKETFYLL